MPELPEDLIEAYLDKVLPDSYSLTSCEKLSAKVAEQLGVIVSPELVPYLLRGCWRD